MTIKTEIWDLKDFIPWGGAIPWYEEVIKAGKSKEFISILEDVYPEGMTETELNDLLWFEPEVVFEWLGMKWED